MLKALRTLIAEATSSLERQPNDQTDEQLIASAAAMLLFEVAWADHDMSDAEIRLIETSLQRLFELPATLTQSLVADAKVKHDTSVGLYEYTRTINDALSPDEKFRLVVALWRLAQSDSHLDALEEHAIRRISELLYVPHAQFIAAKQKARTS